MNKQFSLELDLTDSEKNVISLASRINKDLFESKIKDVIISLSQNMINEYASQKLYQNNNSNKKEDLGYIVNKGVTYKYVDKEWKRKILDTILKASELNRLVSIDELYKVIGVVDNKRHFSRKIGLFLKQSGVKVKKHCESGTTITEYYV